MGSRGKTANPNLTVEEEEVLSYIADGMTQEEIGWRMSKTKRAVEHHCNMIRWKLGAKNIPNAVAIAYRREILLTEDK